MKQRGKKTARPGEVSVEIAAPVKLCRVSDARADCGAGGSGDERY